jgi:hypothetical protein
MARPRLREVCLGLRRAEMLMQLKERKRTFYDVLRKVPRLDKIKNEYVMARGSVVG